MTHLFIIGVLRTGTSQALVKAALDREYEVTIISPEEDDLRTVYPAEVKIISMPMDPSLIVNRILEHIKFSDSPFLVTTTNDKYIECAAEVCEMAATPGPNPICVGALASKANQRRFLLDFDLATPLFKSVSISEVADLKNILGQFRFPIVIKPERGASSLGVFLCCDVDEAACHVNYLVNDFHGERKHCITDILLIEEFLPGHEYCVEIFDGQCVGVIRKEKRTGNAFIERAYTSELDLDSSVFRSLVLTCEKAVVQAGLTWGPVHIDCITRDGAPYIVEINARIAGSFIAEIVKDAYGFDMVDALLSKLNGMSISVPPLSAPAGYARVEFFLNGDPDSWNLNRCGLIETHELYMRYGPQQVESRERLGYLYVARKTCSVQPPLESRTKAG